MALLVSLSRKPRSASDTRVRAKVFPWKPTIVLYTQGMRSFEQYDEICKYFAEGKQKDNDANEVQKQLQLHDLSVGILN